MKPGATNWHLDARRRYNETASGVSLDSASAGIIGTRFIATGILNYVDQTAQMMVNGATVIPATAITGGTAGVLYTTPNYAELTYQNAVSNSAGDLWGFLNTADLGVLNGVNAALKAFYGTP